jgi:hypothetical protein
MGRRSLEQAGPSVKHGLSPCALSLTRRRRPLINRILLAHPPIFHSQAEFGSRLVEDDALAYVHRRHAGNVSAPHRKDLWQGVLPLQLAGADAMTAPETVRQVIGSYAAVKFVQDGAGLGQVRV